VEVSFPDGPKQYVFENIDLAPNQEYPFTLPDLYPLVEGENDMTIQILSINDGVADQEECNSSVSRALLGVVPTPGKQVLLEEGTGTWCGWCPRGDVFLNRLSEKYPDHYVTVAVHNADPMVVDVYDGVHGFGGYPAATVNRKSSNTSFGTQADLELPFLEYIGGDVRARLDIGAVEDPDVPNLFTFSVKVDATVPLNILNRVMIIITEDGVTGASSGYAQANFYSGGSVPMGGYENLPNPVPASQMVYNHVARAVPLGGSGDNSFFRPSMAPGESRVAEYAYLMPEEYDRDKVHVIVALLDARQDIDNVKGYALDEALANGLLTSSREVNGFEQAAIYPHPVGSELRLSFDSKANEEVQISIENMLGATISSEPYEARTGVNHYTSPVGSLPRGSYLVEIRSEDRQTVMKFVKE